MSDAQSTRYEAKEVEARWYAAWTKASAFKPEAVKGDGAPFVVVIPPPNVTGILHMGHALNNTLQDALVRFQRMNGRKALWVPGTDHAGIATQNVVEKALAKEGRTRDQLGRDAFLKRTWEWKEKYGGTIIEQLKRLGCSCDWDRTRFTMDEGLSRAVLTAFARLFEKGLIYRGERLINWCPRCETALSDEEAESKEERGKFYHLKYPVKGQRETFINVATTRPETMLGDTAVAVHPSDERYRGLVGKSVILPLLGREIPIIADVHADPEKGSGAVKITPAHDFNDFLVGERHGLPKLRIFDDRGHLNDAAGPYRGMERFAARARVVLDLDALGLIERIEDKDIPLPRCYRCDTIVEPHLSKQWFVKMRPMLERAAVAVRSGDVRILPDRYQQTYLSWVEQYRDWCISRQIWWGHRIPVWYDADETPVASVTPLKLGSAHPVTGKPLVRQDDDVLDTWFSSQLWPFSVSGWPDASEDLKAFYPTDVLVTGRDIIYFWVARMVMCGLEFLGKAPFHTVYINGTVLDHLGRRMSKSLGNGIDPLEMGEKYGTDAVRWTLVSLTTEGQDLRLAESRFEGGRNFINKLWNASRFVLMNLEDAPREFPATSEAPEDRWILSRLEQVVQDATAALASCKFHHYTQVLYDFAWNVFCDWYLELTKARLADLEAEGRASRLAAQGVLFKVLDTLLRLLHPVIPFVTEEIRERMRSLIGKQEPMLILASWPKSDPSMKDPAAESEIEMLISLVKAARSTRDRMGLAKSAPLEVWIRTRDAASADVVSRVAGRAKALARLSSVVAGTTLEKPPQSVTLVDAGLEIFVPLAGLIDLDAERDRLKKEAADVEGWLSSVRKKLENPGFRAKAPPEVIASETERMAELSERAGRLAASLKDLL